MKQPIEELSLREVSWTTGERVGLHDGMGQWGRSLMTELRMS